MKRWALIVVAVSGLLAAPAVTAQAERTVCMASSRGCDVRPHLMGIGARSLVRSLKWQSWGDNRAVAFGRFESPATCCEPRYGPYPAKLILSVVGECQGRLYYSRRTLKIGKRHGKVFMNNEPFGPCYYP